MAKIFNQFYKNVANAYMSTEPAGVRGWKDRAKFSLLGMAKHTYLHRTYVQKNIWCMPMP